ncbi:5452_t:CDS:10, partial [Ambispora gerdemannii]
MTGPRDLNIQIESLVTRLRRRQVVGSFSVSLETALLLRQVVSNTRWREVEYLIKLVKDVGNKLVLAQPRELAVGNIVRRVLRLIRDCCNSDGDDNFSISDSPVSGIENDELNDEDDEFEEEERPKRSYAQRQLSFYDGGSGSRFFGSSSSMINLLGDNTIPGKKNSLDYEKAMEHIHSNEIIMTIGKSKTVETFLKTAAKKLKFQVVVAETSPTYSGHEMALSLSQAGIDTTVITDSAIFAVMSRVNKVILGIHAVLANGGLIAVSGTQMVAAAAKYHSTPVVVCTGLYKLSPLYPYDEDSFNDLAAPDSVLNFDQGELVDNVTLLNPYYDYVKPEHVNLFITNTGGHPPSYLYRLINENYDPEDTYCKPYYQNYEFESYIFNENNPRNDISVSESESESDSCDSDDLKNTLDISFDEFIQAE